MKLVLATLVAATAVALALGALATFNLRTFVDAHRHELIARAERTLARPLHVAAVEPSWWPLGIRFAGVTISEDPRFGTVPFLDAAAVRISVRLWPLALGRVEVASIILEQPRMTLVRVRGDRWNVTSLGADEGRREDKPTRTRRRRGLQVPIEWVVGMTVSEVRDGRLEIEDRSGPVPRRFTAEKLRLRAQDVRLGGEARLRVDAVLFPGSVRPDAHLDLRVSRLGERDANQTPFVARIELRDADLATLGTLAGYPDRYGGRLSSVSAEVTGTLARFAVALEARSDGQALRLGPHLALPAAPASLRGGARYEHGAIALEEARATFGSLALVATGTAELEPWHADLTVQTAAGSAAMLALVDPPVRVSDLVLSVALEPGTARVPSGRMQLDGAPVEVAGAVGSLDPLAFSGRFQASAFGGSLTGTLEIAHPSRVLTLHAEGSSIDVAAVTARFAPDVAERVSGRADGSVTMALRLDDAVVPTPPVAVAPPGPTRATLASLSGAPLGSLTGAGTLRLTDASLRGLNVPELVLAPVGEMRFIPRLLSARTRARYPEVFDSPDTRVQTATVSFTIGDGELATERLVVEAEPYEIVGSGAIDANWEIRFHGDLVLSPALSAALRADLHAARYLVTSGGRVAVPFRMRGPLGHAHPEPDMKRLRARGLQLLTEAGDDARRKRWRPGAADAPRPRQDADGALIERLRGMLRP